MAKKTSKPSTNKPKTGTIIQSRGCEQVNNGFVKVAIAEDYELAAEYCEFLKIYHIPTKIKLINPEDFYSYAILVQVCHYDKSYDLIDRRSTNRDSDPAVFADEDSLDTETDEFSVHDNLRDYHIYIDPHWAA